MTSVAQSHRITPLHPGRKAGVYLRQSSEKQVRQNTERQRLQYALAPRARALGWQEVEIIDADPGRSAIGAALREGFERLVSEPRRRSSFAFGSFASREAADRRSCGFASTTSRCR